MSSKSEIFATTLGQLRHALAVQSSSTLDGYLVRGMPGADGVPGGRGKPGGRTNRYPIGPAIRWMIENVWSPTPDDDSPLPAVTDDPEMRAVKLDRQRVLLESDREDLTAKQEARELRQGVLVEKDAMTQYLNEISAILRQATDQIKTTSGAGRCECHQVLTEALDDAERLINVYFPADDGGSNPLPGTDGSIPDRLHPQPENDGRCLAHPQQRETPAGGVLLRDALPAPPARRRARKPKAKTPPKVNPKTKKVK